MSVDSWLTVPDVAERLSLDAGRVRQLLQERRLLGIRRGDPPVLQIPERFLVVAGERWEVLPTLQGTLVLLADAGFSDGEAIDWLFAPDPSLPGAGPEQQPPAPVDSLRHGHRTEVRRRAQALAL